MTREELITRLRAIALEDNVHNDTERTHQDADGALLECINDAEITAAFEAVPRWYA